MENLTTDNFWNKMTEKYPAAMERFSKWIDNYKVSNNWEILFNAGWHNGFATMAHIGTGAPLTVATKHQTPKYHELPVAIQLGIFSEFLHEELREDTQSLFIKDVRQLIEDGIKAI